MREGVSRQYCTLNVIIPLGLGIYHFLFERRAVGEPSNCTVLPRHGTGLWYGNVAASDTRDVSYMYRKGLFGWLKKNSDFFNFMAFFILIFCYSILNIFKLGVCRI